MVRFENNSHMLELLVKLRFCRFLNFFDTFAHKKSLTWYVLHETWRTTVFGIYDCVEVIGIEKDIHMLEITC